MSGTGQTTHPVVCRRLTPNIYSSNDLNRPEAKRFRVKLTNLNIPKIDLADAFIDLLEAENLKSKNLTDEYPAFMPAYVAAIVHSSEHESMRINEFGSDSFMTSVLLRTPRLNALVNNPHLHPSERKLGQAK